VKAVKFKDGSELAADLVVMAVGIRPNTGSPKPPVCIAGAASW